MTEVSVVPVMLAVELVDVTANTISKVAMKRGMNNFVFVMYSNAFASFFLFLLALIFYRKRKIPPLKYNVLGLFFLNGLMGFCYQVFKNFGIGYSSPTLASALSNLIPPFTFILAILFRMEKLNWKSNSTWAKSIGTFVSITGALIITLYKGQPLINNHPSLKLFYDKIVSSFQLDWIIGAVLLSGASFVLSVCYIILAKIIREFPVELLVVLIRVTFTCLFSIPGALILEKDPKALILAFDTELIAIGCQATFVLSLQGIIHTWAVRKRGPVFVAMFKPLEIVFAVILGITFLGDSLCIGSVIGALIVVGGFYGVIWGKSQEKVEEECIVYSCESHDPVLPLLQNKRVGE